MQTDREHLTGEAVVEVAEEGPDSRFRPIGSGTSSAPTRPFVPFAARPRSSSISGRSLARTRNESRSSGARGVPHPTSHAAAPARVGRRRVMGETGHEAKPSAALAIRLQGSPIGLERE